MTARILVVDDNPDIAGMLSELLTYAGHQTATAPNGVRALERIAESDFDIIISDVMMPELDGKGFYRELAARHPRYVRRVIFITGHEDPQALAFLGESPIPVLRKPFTFSDLNREIDTALEDAGVTAGGSAG